ncbi:hypothetical protein PISMIDRAFT_678161 [Pisolithus microcarpus 441]|uniref:Unplaced genomic scaffold scaffold_31, whole genome shotgun sequence n=1 Tax=Pisolithus microcarpus 441 TaxID=765257 RepID=A0A0C9ZF52_9AGAM|nr:hypothetical protein PISMIDRAFT_678161 [Pisolithus microcarpus 441]
MVYAVELLLTSVTTKLGRFRLLEKSNVVDARTWQCLCSCLEMFILAPGNVYEPRLDSTGLH